MPIYPYSFQLPPLNVQDIPNDGAPGEFLGINGSGVLDWLPVATGGGDMLKADNLSGLTNYATARTNIGLGTASTPTFANLTLTSPSLSSSAPVTISQTWNAGTNVMTALKVVATDTASGATSNLLELWAGSTPILRFNVAKNGTVAFRSGSVFGDIATDGVGRVLLNASTAAGARVTGDLHIGSNDVILVRDSASGNTLALRNGAAAQTFRVYGAYPDTGINYARLALSCDTSGNATISTQALGTYTAGTVSINGVPVGLGKGNVASNIAIGPSALNANTTGSRNIAIGNESLLFVTTGLANTAIGAGALRSALAGASSIANTAIGDLALNYCATSTYNTAIGQGAGTFVLSGSTLSNSTYSVFIGPDAKANSNGETNQIAIGYNAQGIGSHSVVLGNDSITKTALKGNVGIGTTSPTSKLHVAETWNNAGTAFCAIKSVITDTNSAAGSDFLELYSGTSTQPLRFDVQKTGQMNIYGAWTDTSNYERLSFSAPSAVNAVIGTNKAGTGTARGLEFQTDGVTRITLSASSHIIQFNSSCELLTAMGTGAKFDFSFNGLQYSNISGLGVSWANNANASTSKHVGLFAYSTELGVVQVNDSTKDTFRDLRVRSVIQQPPATITPATNGDLVVEATSNTLLTFKLKGTDGTVRTGTIALV